MALNINSGSITGYSGLDAHTIANSAFDVITDQEEIIYQNDRWQKDWNAFNQIPKLKSAILMKAVWTCGKGFTCDARTKAILDHLSGNGKQTFLDILFNMIVTKQIGRDAFAEIIRDEEDKFIYNLKILDPSSIRIIYGRDGLIKRYEQRSANPGSGAFTKFQPEDIFHLSNNTIAGQIHGISVPESVEKIILADDENFQVMQRLTRFQAVPFIIFKLKTDDVTKINNFKEKLKRARSAGEDFCIPDDENLLSFEVVQVNPSSLLMEWRNSINNQFYQAVGMPLILFGSAGSTESGGKIEYLGHETIFEHDQLELEQQIEAQLGLRINLNSPTSLLENLQTDETKDNQNALTMQPSDVQAGAGR